MNYRNIQSTSDLQVFLESIQHDSNSQVFRSILEKDGKDNKDIKPSIHTKIDSTDIIYANQEEINNIFEHIIIFTNDRSRESNKTLDNVYEAIDNLKKAKCKIIPKLHVFVAADVVATEDESEITISDDTEEFTISAENNTDTLIFSRLGVQGEYDCEHAVKLLQDRGFLILNPVNYSALACDKYESAILFQKGGIPQPNFTIMTKDILYDKQNYMTHMREVYKNWKKDDGDNEDKELVIKILDGHGGTGVFLTNGNRMYAILQAFFAKCPSLRLLIQKKEEADGGDIRVHVLTLKNKQVIIGAMKRVKISGDFRSNVSLGATAEPIKLSKEQEEIALKTAKLSKLPWCAVDIMPLVKGSNPELGDNVVLEINASPGTAGISDVLKTNLINILLSNLTDPSEFCLQDKISGYIESVELDWGHGPFIKYLAKLDTGNGAHASHIEVGDYEESDNKISFYINNKKHTFDIIERSHARTGEKETADRPIIIVPELKLGLRHMKNVKMGIVKSRNKSTNVLLNRSLISQLGYVVSPNLIHLLTPEMQKQIIL